MKKNWFKRNPGVTFIIAGGLIYSFERSFETTFAKHFPESEYGWVGPLIAVCAMILVLMWALTQKGRSFWWLLLIIPVPIAYFFLKNLEIPQQ